MNKMWIDFLENVIFEDIDTVIKLIMFDNKIQGSSNDINSIVEFLKNGNFMSFDIKDDVSFVLEGDSNILINVLGYVLNSSSKIYLFQNNLGFNKWLFQKFNEFCRLNNIENNIIVNMSEVIDDVLENPILIGSKSFVNEIDDMLEADCQLIII